MYDKKIHFHMQKTVQTNAFYILKTTYMGAKTELNASLLTRTRP